MPNELIYQFACAPFPDLGCAVDACRGDMRPVRAESRAIQCRGCVVFTQGLERRAATTRPDPRRAILAGGENILAILAEHRAVHTSAMAAEGRGEFVGSGRGIPRP